MFNFQTAVKNIETNRKKIEKVILEDMAVKADQYVPEDTGRTRIEMTINYPGNFVMWSNE